MSLNAQRYERHHRRCCPCGKSSVFYSPMRRRYRFMADHPLCRRCFRAQAQRDRARLLGAAKRA